jgi:hypothetical protein
VDEAVTAIMVLYRRVHPGGVDRGELAQLAELYHRAMRRLDTYRKANDSFASSAAQVVGAVVATVVVTIASGGTLGPVAVGALAGLGGAASSAATRAAIRLDNTTLSVLKDAGAGTVEGIAAAAGASLAARIVRGTTAGLSAGRAATMAGARAAGHASGGFTGRRADPSARRVPRCRNLRHPAMREVDRPRCGGGIRWRSRIAAGLVTDRREDARPLARWSEPSSG